MAEKTEQATPKKLRDARKKGQVAKSQDFPSALTFIISISSILMLSGYIFKVLASLIISFFRQSATPQLNFESILGGVLEQVLTAIFQCSLPILLLTVCTGVLTNFLVIGPVFSAEAMKPDLKRLNPVTNIKNMFKFKTLFELLKSLFKIFGAFILIWSVVYNSLDEIIACAALPIMGSVEVFVSFLIKVIIRVGIFFLSIAVIDLVFQKRNFAKEMKMEKYEVKQEYKDTEGNPHIKSQRRRLAQEIAYQEGPAGVRKARAVITNPTHLAVAIQYKEEEEPAPYIVTMGKGLVADQIIKKALEHNIPIMRNVDLAHTLFEKGEIGDYIPEETYQAVSEILRWLESIGKEEIAHLELFK